MRGPARSPYRPITKARQSRGATIPAPVGGWDAFSPLAEMPAQNAVVLDNFFPRPDSVEVRRGHTPYCGGVSDGPIESLMVYSAGTVAGSKMFAAADAGIYDATLNSSASLVVSGLTSSRWQYCNFSTSGGHFLVCVNGADAVRNYDGSTWTMPTITGTGITSANFVHVNAHQNRLWFVINDSMDAAYLPVNSIAGTAVKFPLGALCNKGGYLVAMSTWTHDGGIGPDDYAVFITSRGQVVVYAGTDPSSASTWRLVGVYDLGAPIGRRCFTKVAGDLALVNIDGVLPLSKALNTDRGAAPGIAITANINNAMNAAGASYKANFGWELTPYPRRAMAILNVPIAENGTAYQYVMNTLTGAWCRFTGWNANCFAIFNDNLYFGGNDGIVQRADSGAGDGGVPIDAVGQTAYTYLGNRGRLKHAKMLQPLVTTSSSARPSVGISTDFKDNASLGTPTTASNPGAVYDTAVWDTSTYAVESQTVADWTSVSGIGNALSVHFRAQTAPHFASAWDISEWDAGLWDAPGYSEISLKVNAFNIITEAGEFI